VDHFDLSVSALKIVQNRGDDQNDESFEVILSEVITI
jgi:hypothetical protein